MNSLVRVRFAPSPTGHLHIGGVRTAMFNWIFARSNGGVYLLRIEDTDRERSSDEYRESQLASLSWVDLLPDEPMVFQYERAPEHVRQARELIQQGKAYPCFCEREDAEELIDRLEQGVGSKYDKTCRNKQFSEQDLLRPHAVRFRCPDDFQTLTFHDAIRGDISVTADQLDDFVIIRRDGCPVYNFCVVIDDIDMKITHIIRGEDHITNTFKQVLLYKALNKPMPIFAHLPLILGPTGAKLSKRDVAVSVESYREMGIMADALFNYLVRLGWSHGDQEIFTREEMIRHFALDQIGKKGAMFDMKKLLWVNGVYMRQSSPAKLFEAIKSMDNNLAAQIQQVWSDAECYALLDLFKDRAETLRDCAQAIYAFSSEPEQSDLTALAKWQTPACAEMLLAFKESLQQNGFNKPLMETAKEITAAHGEKLVALAQPLRFALTGTVNSPGIFEMITVLGVERTVQRIEGLVKRLS